ncbi:dihydroorotate dehydrogenase electron transfer subunit [Bacillus oleivorans]|uniref:Dihydroorotate dehydrogenase B (NAD(+)), electron transfer subunit n=1 Tax=Bacillus oleivorans TaxID=1448271 RepID=A0A285D0Z0_9BACI|nr:dihydroorotate dehydrogenase electron transfer subunit [Bacillus oleivorans]SNX73507.1 dihydroorotate dehydrogenase electron transfer subunit [Bacillus oleivorans]
MRIDHMKVIEHQSIATNTFRLVLEGELVEEISAPGQFVHVQVGSDAHLLRRPISISEFNHETKQCTLIYRAGGDGTKLLSKKQAGEEVNVLGPLGNGYSLPEETSSVLIVGGGIGVPPLYELSKQLTAAGHQVTHVLGFQNKEAVFLKEEFAELGPTFIATDDGSEGQKGFVTDVINQLHIPFDVVYACGPTPMLKALQTRIINTPLFISLEERMGCGIGACFACVVKQTSNAQNYYKICCDGPVFAAKEVVI